MAECYRTVSGDFDELLEYLSEGIMQAYMSSSLEASRDFEADGSRLAVRVFERYGWSSSNRLSLTLTMFQGRAGGAIEVYAVGSGGSRGMLFKINTWSESGFVDTLRMLINEYELD